LCHRDHQNSGSANAMPIADRSTPLSMVW